MGSGKTVTGRILASLLNITFIDLDSEIEKKSGKSIRFIFEKQGETVFRELEQEALHATLPMTELVVSCGGGTACFYDNLEWMKSHGTVFYLMIDAVELTRRLETQLSERPLLTGIKSAGLGNFIHEKLAEREKFYRQAHHTIQSPESAELAAREIMRLIDSVKKNKQRSGS